MGDSQMNKLVNQVQLLYPYNITSMRYPDSTSPLWGRCDNVNYYYLEPSHVWASPAVVNGKQIQGPTAYGLHSKHYCNDASGLVNRQYASASLNFMEYLGVEYASDVEHPSTITNTSQESAVHYMKNQLSDLYLTREDAVCVVNTGVHDQRLCPGLGNEETCMNVYLRNVERYVYLLNSTCGNILWISITSVRGDANRPQNNSRSILWNQGVNTTLETDYADSSHFFIDVWNASLHADRNDNIHFLPVYYEKLASLFASLM